MAFLKIFLITILCLGIIILSVIFLLNRGVPKPNQPYNVHTWKLPDDSNIKYYEIFEGHGGFTANLFQYLVYQKGSEEKTYYIGNGGTYESLRLYSGKNGKILWLMGRYAGQKDSHIISALDINEDIFIGYTKMDFPENELTRKERELKKQLIIGEGVIVPVGKK
jgi:hypothetical protein